MKKALLAVSFGTSFAETRRLTLEAIEADLRRAFPERDFFRAWTSSMLTKKLRETEGVDIDTVPEAMERLLAAGVTDLLVQPTHMMNGAEFDKVRAAIEASAGRFPRLAVGAPLLSSPADVPALAKVLEGVYAGPVGSGLLALMGHGSARPEGAPYAALEQAFRADGFENFVIGTVEFEPGFAPVLEKVRSLRPEKVWLAPLLVVAGDHVLNDMAGDEPEAWANRITAEGVQVQCVLRGLGEYPEVREMYVQHARRAEAE